MTAYVHIGTGKTGTTTIQVFLDENHEKLKEKGILYSNVNLSSNRHIYLIYIVDFYLKGKKEDSFVKDIIKKLKEELKQNPNKTFIFSSEDILWWCKDVENASIALKEFFTEIGFDDIKIIVYIRSQADLFLSLCSQEVKNADPTFKCMNIRI